jgi:hypothetical protein
MIGKALALLALVAAASAPIFLLPADVSGQGSPNPPRWVFQPPPPQAQLNRDFQEVATLSVKVGQKHALCWFNPNTKKVGTKDFEETALQLAYRRYRVEGGPLEVSDVLQFADWKPELDAAGVPIARRYCTESSGIPRAGHWVFEAQMCRTPYVSDAESCSAWMSSIQRFSPSGGGGMLDDKPRGWWIYAFIPAPTGVGT